MSRWYYLEQSIEKGPVTIVGLVKFLETQKDAGAVQVRQEFQDDFSSVSRFPELGDFAANAGPEIAINPREIGATSDGESGLKKTVRIVALVVSVLIGGAVAQVLSRSFGPMVWIVGICAIAAYYCVRWFGPDDARQLIVGATLARLLLTIVGFLILLSIDRFALLVPYFTGIVVAGTLMCAVLIWIIRWPSKLAFGSLIVLTILQIAFQLASGEFDGLMSHGPLMVAQIGGAVWALVRWRAPPIVERNEPVF